jgi:hypothetical protein
VTKPARDSKGISATLPHGVRITLLGLLAGSCIDLAWWHRDDTPTPGLIACRTFDESGGQIVRDISPNHNDAYLGNSPHVDAADPQWVDLSPAPDTSAGKRQRAALFGGRRTRGEAREDEVVDGDSGGGAWKPRFKTAEMSRRRNERNASLI